MKSFSFIRNCVVRRMRFFVNIDKGVEEKSRLFALLQRPQGGENGESYRMTEHGLGAAHRRRKRLGCDGFTRYSDRLSADHFLPAADEACAVRYG